jgi:hypothetical protein
MGVRTVQLIRCGEEMRFGLGPGITSHIFCEQQKKRAAKCVYYTRTPQHTGSGEDWTDRLAEQDLNRKVG